MSAGNAPSWDRWEWMHVALHTVRPMPLRMWLRVHVHRRIVIADRFLTTPRSFKRVQGGNPGEQAQPRDSGLA